MNDAYQEYQQILFFKHIFFAFKFFGTFQNDKKEPFTVITKNLILHRQQLYCLKAILRF